MLSVGGNAPRYFLPGPLQAVDGVALQRRQNGSQRREVLQDPTLLSKQRHKPDLAELGRFLSFPQLYFLSRTLEKLLKNRPRRPRVSLTRATSIHRSSSRALWLGFSAGLLRQVVMTQLVTELNWATVALMVGARCSFPFLSRWDQIPPRQWYGTTFLNRSCADGERRR